MVDISRPVNRTVKTDIAGSVDVTPSGGSTGKAIVAADLVDGFTKKTVNFAAGDTAKNVAFAVVDDTELEGTETYRLTFSNPQPSGAFPDGMFVEGTVADNETAPPANIFGPVTTADTNNSDGTLQTVGNTRKYKLTGTVVDSAFEFWLGATDSDGMPCFVIYRLNPDRVAGANMDASGTRSVDNNWSYLQDGGHTGGANFVLIVDRDAATLSLTIGTMPNGAPWVQSMGSVNVGPFFRFKTGGAAQPITVTAVS